MGRRVTDCYLDPAVTVRDYQYFALEESPSPSCTRSLVVKGSNSTTGSSSDRIRDYTASCLSSVSPAMGTFAVFLELNRPCSNVDGSVPDFLPTDYRYEGSNLQSPADITQKMTNGMTLASRPRARADNDGISGLGGLRHVPDDKLPNDDLRAFKAYMTNNWERFSLWDGGCMMYNVSCPRHAKFRRADKSGRSISWKFQAKARYGFAREGCLRLLLKLPLSLAAIHQWTLRRLSRHTFRPRSQARRCDPRCRGSAVR